MSEIQLRNKRSRKDTQRQCRGDLPNAGVGETQEFRGLSSEPMKPNLVRLELRDLNISYPYWTPEITD